MSVEPSPQRSGASAAPDRFIGDAEQEEITNLSRTTRWRLERQGQFPKTYKISPNRSARLLSEVTDWMQARRGLAA
jgi:prophage regulatory protein